MQSGWEGGIRDLTPRERGRPSGSVGEETGVEGFAGRIRGPREVEGFQGQGWEEGRSWVAGEGTEVEGRAREA